MKRGSLFFIGLLSAIVTIVSLNFAFGSTRNHRYYGYHRCYDRHDYDRNNKEWQRRQPADSTQSNY